MFSRGSSEKGVWHRYSVVANDTYLMLLNDLDFDVLGLLTSVPNNLKWLYGLDEL